MVMIYAFNLNTPLLKHLCNVQNHMSHDTVTCVKDFKPNGD